MKRITGKKGFTLAELLIVVAIIGVLVAISIPIFTQQLKKARLATNQANARAAYAAAIAWYLENTDEDDITTKEDIEGVVIECEEFMTKLKFPYYNFWKFMRSLKDSVANNRSIKLSRLYKRKSNGLFYYRCYKKYT